MNQPNPDIASRTQLFEVSTLFGLATLVAALDQGLFGDSPRRVLVTSNNVDNPEVGDALRESPSFAALAARFHQVVSYNEAIAPLHPRQWMPSETEQPLWERFLRLTWGLGDEPVHLVTQSIQAPPAKALVAAFAQASIDIYADGLMTWSPTRNRVVSEIGLRIDRVLHLDLVPGVEPLVLSEYAVPRQRIDTDRMRTVLRQIDADVTLPPVEGPCAILLGQYLSALRLISTEQEQQLHVEMLEAAVGRGLRSVVFKPHPSAPVALTERLLHRGRELGVEVIVYPEPVLAEALYDRLDVRLVVGCFSTGLMTARVLFGIAAVRVGTELLLRVLKPYANGNRVPLVIVDSLLPGPDSTTPSLTVAETNELVEAVGFVMQPELLAPRRERVAAWLTSHPELARFFPAVRLGELGLPGGRMTARTALTPTLRRAARRAYALERRLEARFIGPLRGGS
ncbi:hypothetical protein HJ590_05580 [Naumannella sp. ID2617S]|nr:hypothetical protein [Naumannella sp. ID2617S]